MPGNRQVGRGGRRCEGNQATWHFAVNDYEGPRAYRKVIGG